VDEGEPGEVPEARRRERRPAHSPSPFSKDALEADKRAFVALIIISHTIQRTVILVQVENEAGTWGAIRDYCRRRRRCSRRCRRRSCRDEQEAGAAAAWKEVRQGRRRDFHAWAVSATSARSRLQEKRVCAAPMRTLRSAIRSRPAGSYESGGLTDNVLAIWKAMMPRSTSWRRTSTC
jgi:hypothetical protein